MGLIPTHNRRGVLLGLSLLITAAVCFWVGVGVGRGESVPRDRIMEICDTCPGRQEKYKR